MKKRGFLLSIILFALAFSISFVWVDSLGWLSISTPFFLFFIFMQDKQSNFFLKGFVWGIIAYTVHFAWVYEVLVNKSTASAFLSLCLSGAIIVYAAITSGVWFWVINRMVLYFDKIKMKMVRVFLSAGSIVFLSLLYFLFLDRYMFWFFDMGYPFLNPILPLLNYQWMKKLLSGLFLFLGISSGGHVYYMPKQQRRITLANKSILCLYLEPCHRKSAIESALEIDNQLRKLFLKKEAKNYKLICVLGPETVVEFPLNKNKELLSLITAALPKNAILALGATRLTEDKKGKTKLYQTVYFLQKGPIIKSYDKKTRVSFAERIPWLWKNSPFARSLFLNRKIIISKGRNSNDSFPLFSGFSLVPRICSELFFNDFDMRGNQGVLVGFVNDSWFPSYFKKLMKIIVYLKAKYFGKEVLYVSH